jgi:hypothetical protein
LTSNSLPNIRLKFDKHFKFVGRQKFVLYGRSQAEQFFFVDADGGQIRRMYLIQFEGYLPNINATYDYAVTKTIDIHGQTYITNTDTVPSVSAVLKQEPESDVARAVTFLTAKGLRFSESVTYQRFVRLVDDAKRNESLSFTLNALPKRHPPRPKTPAKIFQRAHSKASPFCTK